MSRAENSAERVGQCGSEGPQPALTLLVSRPGLGAPGSMPRARLRPCRLAPMLLAAFLAAVSALVGCRPGDADPTPTVRTAPAPEPAAPLFSDDFSAPVLDEGSWVRTLLNDFETEAVDIADGRLRMMASSIGTDDTTIKYHGIRSREAVVDPAAGVVLSFEVDWNAQRNGCYMTAGVCLSPSETDDPEHADSVLRFTYIGVPPGQNARAWAALKVAGRSETPIYTENWPDERKGRPIARQSVVLHLTADSLTVEENGKTLFTAKDLDLDLGPCYVYLQHSTHSNYGPREVFFDNVEVREAGGTEQG